MITKLDYLLKLPFDFILEFSYLTSLVKLNNNYFTKLDYINRLIKSLTLNDCININNYYDDGLSCKEISYKYLYNYPNAIILKKEFYRYLSLLNEDVGYFIYEVPIPSSRVDIARIKNKSYAYEIKSKRDNTKRLKKQLEAMNDIFEISYIIIGEGLAINFDLDNVGVYKYHTTDEEITFNLEKEALINNDIDPNKQLSLFDLKNLVHLYTNYFDETPKTSGRDCLLDIISEKCPPDFINDQFKHMLMTRQQTIHV